MSLVWKFLGWVFGKLFGGSDSKESIELGEKRQQAANSQADIDAIKRANIAARKAEDDPDAFDPNDRSTRH